ncbi:6-carboxytetrahydropterin synthase QueD [Prolixibacteraceae bacterium JC049]|nr:6-carboxytetrahydropterin synthase QueD [Prolixibacteraceae bacterium JC049]
MAKIRLTKQYDFEMAHALYNYDGRCRNVHGHSYKLSVTIIGEPLKDDTHPKNGMVMDFGDLKKIVQEDIVDSLDHALVTYKDAPQDKLLELGVMYERYHVFDFQPTSENLVIYIAEQIQKALPERVQLHSIRLNETTSSFAEWYASDNL